MNLIFHNIWDVILPIDELHHFSRWLLHHQPVGDWCSLPFHVDEVFPEGNAFASSAGAVQIALPPCAATAVAIVPSQAVKSTWITWR